MVGRSRSWVQDNLPRRDDRRYDPAEIHRWVVDQLKRKHESRPEEIKSKYERNGDLDEINRRKKLAEAQNAEETLKLNRLKVARMKKELMPVDWVHRWLREAAAELRKPIEIIGRNHPEHKQLILNGLDNASAKVSEMLSDDQSAE